MMAFSATYTAELRTKLHTYMHAPQHINLCEETVSLDAIRQFYQVVDAADLSAQVRAYSDVKVANRTIWVWHGGKWSWSEEQRPHNRIVRVTIDTV